MGGAIHIDVNGTRLWFDVDGPGLVPDQNKLRQRPTVVLVHGGPGVYDHSYFKPDFAPLGEHAQVAGPRPVQQKAVRGIPPGERARVTPESAG